MEEMGALVEDLSPPSYDRPSWRSNTNNTNNNSKGLTKIIIEEGTMYGIACGYNNYYNRDSYNNIIAKIMNCFRTNGLNCVAIS